MAVVCMECVVAPRAYWKGYLKLSLVSCPIALYPATSEREKISFHQINKNTGNRIKYRKVDAETGDEVESDDSELRQSFNWCRGAAAPREMRRGRSMLTGGRSRQVFFGAFAIPEILERAAALLEHRALVACSPFFLSAH
jgi:hypothetical protein